MTRRLVFVKKSWKDLASVYIGTVIGAGFASGQEIIQFFGVFGYKGLLGVVLASFLFSLVGSIVLLQVYKNKISCYTEYINSLLGNKIGNIFEVIVILYLFICYIIMLAGSGAIFYEQFKVSMNLGIFIMTLLSFLTLVFSVKGISFVNRLVVPLLIIGITLVGFTVIIKEGFTFSNFFGTNITKTGNWLTSSILYVSYNSISGIVMLSSLLSIINSEKQAIKGGIMGGIGLGIMGLFILLSTLILYTDIYNMEIPMIKASKLLGDWGPIMYSGILWLAMFTTAIASGFGCINRIFLILGEGQFFITAIFCIIAVPFAKIGFSSLVSSLYPLFGYLGLLMLLYIIINQIYIIIDNRRNLFKKK